MATWGEILAEIEDENDLAEEVFVDSGELLTYANSGLEDLEKKIHVINDNHFAADTSLALVNGTSTYSLPSDIYSTKINGIFYNDGSTKYEIKPLKNLSEIPDIDTNDDYRYRIINTTASGRQIKLYPASRETSSSNVTIFYRRVIKLFVDSTSVLDIPEAKEFVKQYVTDKVKNKERNTPDAPESDSLVAKRKDLLDSLEKMIDDDNTEVAVNTDYYEEFR
jgi:hypothetical protein